MTTAPVRRRKYVAPPTRVYSQDEQRVRRRGWLRNHYHGDFDLAVEVTAIISPLAAELAALPHPLALRRDVDNVADGVHEVVSSVVGMLAESKHLDRAARARTAQAVFDLAQRPDEPLITEAELTTGLWAAVLVSHVAPFARDFASHLGAALPPNDPNLQRAGQLSASERLEAALRGLDLAALDLSRRIPKVARYQALPSIESRNATRKAQHDSERARRQLAKMGIEATP